MKVGEQAYMREKGADAIATIRSRPAWFAGRTVSRAVAFWTGGTWIENQYWMYGRLRLLKRGIFTAYAVFGIAGLWVLWRERHRMAPQMTAILVIYPLPYYVVRINPRFHAPLEPVLLVLGGVAAAAILSRVRKIEPASDSVA
jgi:hypothetical protein